MRQSLPRKFVFANTILFFFYLFCNPYRYCRKFLQKRGEANIYAYGETPLNTLRLLAQKCGLKPEDTWLDLGSGRGQGTLWIAASFGCKAIGVDWISRFVKRANWAARLARLPASFFHADILEAPFEKASLVYLYGTSWSDETMAALAQKMQKLPKGARIISISDPLEAFPLLEVVPVSFPWGDTHAYLHGC